MLTVLLWVIAVLALLCFLGIMTLIMGVGRTQDMIDAIYEDQEEFRAQLRQAFRDLASEIEGKVDAQ